MHLHDERLHSSDGLHVRNESTRFLNGSADDKEERNRCLKGGREFSNCLEHSMILRIQRHIMLEMDGAKNGVDRGRRHIDDVLSYPYRSSASFEELGC